MIGGIVPDTDFTYTVTIRATGGHGKYADAVFRMVVRGRYLLAVCLPYKQAKAYYIKDIILAFMCI